MNKLRRNPAHTLKTVIAVLLALVFLQACAPPSTDVQTADTPAIEGEIIKIGEDDETDSAKTDTDKNAESKTGDTQDSQSATEPTQDETADTATEPEPTVLEIPTTAPEPTAEAEQPAKPSPIPLQTPTPSTILLTTAFTNDSKVTTVGIDEVFFGMLAEEAAEAASTEWLLVDGSAHGTCYQVTPKHGPDGVTLWIVDGHVERVDVGHPDIRTPSSFGVGTELSDLQNHLGAGLTVETHTDGDGNEIEQAVFTPSDEGDKAFRFIFDIENGAVTKYRSGRVGVVERDTCKVDS